MKTAAGLIFTAEQASVDANWIRVAGKSYAVRQVRSVEVRSYRRMNGFWQLALVLSALLAIVALGSRGEGSTGWYPILIVTAVLAAAGAIMHALSKQHIYSVLIRQGHLETRVLETPSCELAGQMRRAIEEAMVAARSGPETGI